MPAGTLLDLRISQAHASPNSKSFVCMNGCQAKNYPRRSTRSVDLWYVRDAADRCDSLTQGKAPALTTATNIFTHARCVAFGNPQLKEPLRCCSMFVFSNLLKKIKHILISMHKWLFVTLLLTNLVAWGYCAQKRANNLVPSTAFNVFRIHDHPSR